MRQSVTTNGDTTIPRVIRNTCVMQTDATQENKREIVGNDCFPPSLTAALFVCVVTHDCTIVVTYWITVKIQF